MIFICDKSRHLVCKPYSISNLHLMAEKLDINKCWYHGGKFPHYDIPKKRVNEISSKCTIVSSKELLNVIHEKN